MCWRASRHVAGCTAERDILAYSVVHPPRSAMTSTAALVQPSAARAETHFDWSDLLLLDEALSEDGRMVLESARPYCQEQHFPLVLEANRHEHFDSAIV